MSVRVEKITEYFTLKLISIVELLQYRALERDPSFFLNDLKILNKTRSSQNFDDVLIVNPNISLIKMLQKNC